MTAPKFDYYWRDYHGVVPKDAIPGGTDRTGKRTYIGQVFICNQGLLTTRIYNGQMSVTASRYEVYTSCNAIKILCSKQPEKFVWVPATASTLHSVKKGKHLVVGGYENRKVLNIGRVLYQDEVIVGKVCGYNVGNALLFFPFKNRELAMDSYHVLVFDNDV